jgi:hypothetical protein
MKPIEQLNKITCQKLRAELNAVLAKYGSEANLSFEIGTIRFSASDARMQLTAKVKGVKTSTDRALEQQMKIHGLQEVAPSGARLTAYNSRRYKYPFSYTENGKNYKAPLDYIIRMGFKKAVNA